MKIKKLSILFIIFAVTILAQPFTANAVVNWTRYSATPVLEKGGSGAWEEAWVERPMVITDGANYTMWYTGRDAGAGTKDQIGRATSADGYGWTKDTGDNPVLSPSVSGWDSANVAFCWVIKMGGSDYRMWYSGNEVSDDEVGMQIGYATSANGINWTKDTGNNPVLPKGGTDDWDGDGIGTPTVIYDADAPEVQRYKMWYVGWNDVLGTQGIGYAYSSNGISWTKYNDGSTGAPYAGSDPVINPGPGGSWEDDGLYSPSVIKQDSIYRMWYDAEAAGEPCRIGYAYSIDGIDWRKYDGNPIIMERQSEAFDKDGALCPMVLFDSDEGVYRMWYVGDTDCDPGPCATEIGYATAPAYQGAHPKINQMGVATLNRASGMHIMLYFIPEGPGPLDVNELKVEGPDGSSYTFSDSDILNWMGTQFPASVISMDPVPAGTYTFSAKANNGLAASNTLNLTVSTISVPQDDAGFLDRAVNDDTSAQVYAGNTIPIFRWKPYLGDQYYYRVRIIDWKYKASWYASDLDIGTNVDGNGYMYAQVSDGMLKSNTPYHWEVEVFDTNNVWSAHNRARSSWYHFYTGTKSATGDFLRDDYAKAFFCSERSFRSGDRGFFAAFVYNLAPWDIDTTTNKFRVDGPGTSHYYNFNPGNDAKTTDPFPFMYSKGLWGFPPDGDYVFQVYEDGSANFESASKTFTGDNTVPRVYREEMTPSDNAYLSGIQPTLTWKSKGSDKWHRVMIFDWNYRRLTWASSYMKDVAEGNEMSVQIPEGTLKEHSPYRWWVEVNDTNKNNRTRSQWLSFMTGGEDNGDINGDNNVDLADAILALKVVVGMTPADINLNADVNEDGKIGVAEIIYILQYVAGLR